MADSRAWFRLYSEFAFDPKVQLLDETLQRRYVMLLCLAAAGVTPTNDVSEVDFALRIGVSECEKTRSTLVSKGLIDSKWFPKAWSKRQFESDSSTDRVKRFRKRQKVVTQIATETASEQNRTEQNRTEKRNGVSSVVPTDVDRVFDHWRETHNHPQSKLDPKRQKVIRLALQAYSAEQLCRCIEGYKLSPHHMGKNERQTVYDDIELFLRDAKHIDAGLKFADGGPQQWM